MKSLSKNQIDLWIINRSRRLKKLPDFLSTEEARQAKQMGSSKAREQFRLSRNCLRWILGQYLDLKPEKLSFSLGSLGKPKLSRPRAPLHFNTSHSKDFIVYSISRKAVGVDIEKIQKRAQLEKISERYFSTKNHKELMKLGLRKRLSFFFQIWTATEAYMKALGKGIGSIEQAKDEIAFSKKPPGLITLEGWNIFLMDVDKSYSLSLASPLKNPEIRIFKF